jgi:hypothetical protein
MKLSWSNGTANLLTRDVRVAHANLLNLLQRSIALFSFGSSKSQIIRTFISNRAMTPQPDEESRIDINVRKARLGEKGL